MKPLIIPLPGNEEMAERLAALLSAQHGRLERRKFPDTETYLRILDDPADRHTILLCTLNNPDEKLLPLIFAAATLRELGAARVGLVAPYLAYMRQDIRFHSGEAITSRQVASLLSAKFHYVVTVDPHLHRYSSLSEIYSIPSAVAHAAPLIAAWIRDNVSDPIIIGPDRESMQWVMSVAQDAHAPFAVLEKQRHSDREVTIDFGRIGDLTNRTPVLVDDIISSGRTMIEAVRGLSQRKSRTPVCIGIHGIFAANADKALTSAGARVVTCNSIKHPTNAIDVSASLADVVTPFINAC